MKNKPSSGTGMLSAAGLSGGVSASGKPKMLALVPPPNGAGKLRTPLPPPPNDPVAVRMTSSSHDVALKGHKETTRRSTDAFADLSQLEVPFFILHFSEFYLLGLFYVPTRLKFESLKSSEFMKISLIYCCNLFL